MARRGRVVIDRELCKGCYLCIRACPVKVLEEDKEPNSTGTYRQNRAGRKNVSPAEAASRSVPMYVSRFTNLTRLKSQEGRHDGR